MVSGDASICDMTQFNQRLRGSGNTNVESDLLKQELPRLLRTHAGLNSIWDEDDLEIENDGDETISFQLKSTKEVLLQYDVTNGIVGKSSVGRMFFDQSSYVSGNLVPLPLSTFHSRRHLHLTYPYSVGEALNMNFDYLIKDESGIVKVIKRTLTTRDLEELVSQYKVEKILQRIDPDNSLVPPPDVTNFGGYPTGVNQRRLYQRIYPTIAENFRFVKSSNSTYMDWFKQLKPANWSDNATWKNYLKLVLLNVENLPNGYDPVAVPADEVDQQRIGNDEGFKSVIKNSDVLHIRFYTHDYHVFLYIIDKHHKKIIRLNTSDVFFVTNQDANVRDDHGLTPDGKGTEETIINELSMIFESIRPASFGTGDEIWRDYFAGYDLIYDPHVGDFQQGSDNCSLWAWFFSVCYSYNLLDMQTCRNLDEYRDKFVKLKLGSEDLSDFFTNCASQNEDMLRRLRRQ